MPNDPGSLHQRRDELEAQIASFAASANAAQYRLLEAIGEFDAIDGWCASGCRSCAEWLSYRIGMTLGPARERVRVARALRELPKISAEMESGQLSYCKARAITRVATPESDEEWVELARLSTGSQLEQMTRLYGREKTDAFGDKTDDQNSRETWLRHHFDEGMMVIQVRVEPEDGERVLAALRAARDTLRDEGETNVSAGTSSPQTVSDVSAETSSPQTVSDVSAGTSSPPTMLDGLSAVAEAFMAHGLGARCGGERNMVLLRTSRAQLGGDTHVGGRIDDGPVVTSETAQPLSCDASVVEVTGDEHGANVLDIGRRTRSIPPAIRRALTVRDEGCRFPGCNNTRYVDAHHIEHWAHGGETKLQNLALLCHRHHQLVHEGGYSIREDFSFWNPEGQQLHESAPPLPVATEPPPADPVGLIPYVRDVDLTMATEGVRRVERCRRGHRSSGGTLPAPG